MTSTHATLDDVREQITNPVGGASMSEAYRQKQMHAVPEFPAIEHRNDILLTLARGEVVLDVGGSGPLHEELVTVAKAVYTIDHDDRPASPTHASFNLDDVSEARLPQFDGVTLVICGEVIEHLSNPGHFLNRLRRQYPVVTVVTVPNATGSVGFHWMQQGVENVNRDHVAWYSWKTLSVLLEERCGYRVASWFWYHGTPRFAEGLIAVCRPPEG